MTQQFVCTACGFNMIGFNSKRCRFCGATPENFLTAEECSATYQVRSITVSEHVTQLKSFPQLGYEHAAYRINTDNAVIWIDCPSSFDSDVASMDYILFTHSDFLGASNLYRQQFGAKVWIHKNDASHPNSRFFTFDYCFENDFELFGIEAVVVGGHSPGFTLYFFEDILFLCDYVGLFENEMTWNGYGNRLKTPRVGKQIHQLLNQRPNPIKTVCGVDYICDYDSWKVMFDRLVLQS
ncbi:MAG: MBL fold metallo-hydrolase [Cyanobacteria bacterium P01_D01_bin.50]